MPIPRTLERIVEDQARRLDEPPAPTPGAQALRPVIALARLPGAGEDELARALSRELGYALFDREIVGEIAASAHARERAVAWLDEQEHPQLAEWLTAFADPGRISPYEYRVHLTRLVAALARRGAAVIVGRGAHLIVRPGQGLRVLVTAPREARVQRLAGECGLTLAEAERRILAIEGQRRAFLRRYFKAELADPAVVDVVVNTHVLGTEGAVAVIRRALRVLQPPAPPGA